MMLTSQGIPQDVTYKNAEGIAESRVLESVQEKLPKEQNANKGIGEIVVVNKEHKFVVVNAGLDNQLKEGSDLKVIRAGIKIGQLRVETVYKKISAAGVTEGDVVEFAIGDSIHLI